MKRLLLSVDDTKASLAVVEAAGKFFKCAMPEEVYLLHVQKLEGHSIMDDLLLSDSEISTLKEALEGTEYKEKLDKKTEKLLDFFEEELKKRGVRNIIRVVRAGHPAEEILKAAKELNADMIIIGSRGRRLHNMFLGSVSREVVNNAEIPVLVAR